MKKGNISLSINAGVIEGPRGLSIQSLRHKETLTNGDNVYEVLREDNKVIGTIVAKKGAQGIQGIQGKIGRGITEVKKVEKIGKTNNWEIKYTEGTSDFISILDGDTAFEVAVDNGFTWEWTGAGEEPVDYGVQEWLKSLIGRGLEFNWSGTKLGVKVEGETNYEYSDDLKGVQGEIGPGNVLSIGTVEKGDEAKVTITGSSPTQVLNFVLPKGDKGNVGEKGEQGNQGIKGNGIKSTQYIKEDKEKVYYEFTYEDGSKFQWSTWKGEAGVPRESAAAGDIVPHNLRFDVTGNWMSITNYKPLPIKEYPELMNKIPTDKWKWERVIPKIDNPIAFDTEALWYDAGINNGGSVIKDSFFSSAMLGLLKGGTNIQLEIEHPFGSKVQPTVTTQGKNGTLHMLMKGTIVEDLIANNTPFLLLVELENNYWSYTLDTNGYPNTNYSHVYGTTGTYEYSFQNDGYSTQFQTQGAPLRLPAFSNTKSDILTTVTYNSLCWEEKAISENVGIYPISPKEMSKIMVAFNVPAETRFLIFKRFEIWIKVPTDDYHFQISPDFFLPEYKRQWGSSSYGDDDVVPFNLSEGIGNKIYLGKKNGGE